MSTFDGRIKEYPVLAIDNFVPNNFSRLYILSHVHTDHTKGLENTNFVQTLYCSKQTARMLLLLETRNTNQLKYSHLKDQIQAVSYYEPIFLDSKEHRIVKLTFFPANHCPGASLILIEGDNGTVLYTGDLRAEPEFVRNKLGSLQKFRIKNLYMDTTCCRSDRRDFILKSDSTDLLVKLVRAYPLNHHMYLDTWTLGYEEMWFSIHDNFHQKIHVSEQRYNMYVNMHKKYKEVLTTDHSSTRFHSCQWDKACFKHEAYMVSIHPTPNRNNKPYEYFKDGKTKELLLTDLPWRCRPYQQMILPFSTHSSLTEIAFFYKFVRPAKFTPCVAHGNWNTLDDMRRLLLEEGCEINSTPSSSEIERAYDTSSYSSSDSISVPTSIDDQQSTAHSTINYLSSVEEPSIQQEEDPQTIPHLNDSGVFSKNNNILSQPLSEKSNNVHTKPLSYYNNNNKSIQRYPSKKNLDEYRSSLSFDHVTPSPESPLPMNEGIVLHRSTPSVSKNATLHRKRSSLTVLARSSSSLSKDIKMPHSLPHSLKRTHSRESFSCYEDEDVDRTCSIDPNVIVLSTPNSLRLETGDTSFSIGSRKETEITQYYPESDDNGGGIAITQASIKSFLRSIKALRKKRRKNRGSAINNPIIL